MSTTRSINSTATKSAATNPAATSPTPAIPLLPDTIVAPFGNYAHGMLLQEPRQVVITSGQLGISKDGAIPHDISAQARLCFYNIEQILLQAGMGAKDVVQLRTYVTARAYFAPYMQVRDEFLQGRPITSTLLIVSGFTRPEFLIEIEATAALF
jgi:enamine deaminase RidA (YjgF/YER057c/UK114 family)